MGLNNPFINGEGGKLVWRRNAAVEISCDSYVVIGRQREERRYKRRHRSDINTEEMEGYAVLFLYRVRKWVDVFRKPSSVSHSRDRDEPQYW